MLPPVAAANRTVSVFSGLDLALPGPVVPTGTGDPLASAGHGSELVWKATTRSGCSNAGGRTRPAVKQGVVATSKLATQKVSAWFGAMAQVRKAWDSRVPGQVQRNVRAPRLKSFKTKTRAGYRKQPVKHWLEQKT